MACFASFGKQGDTRDHLFVEDAHLAPRFFVACPDLFAYRHKFCANRGKFCADVATQCGKISGDGGHLFGQLA